MIFRIRIGYCLFQEKFMGGSEIDFFKSCRFLSLPVLKNVFFRGVKIKGDGCLEMPVQQNLYEVRSRLIADYIFNPE